MKGKGREDAMANDGWTGMNGSAGMAGWMDGWMAGGRLIDSLLFIPPFFLLLFLIFIFMKSVSEQCRIEMQKI